MQNTVPVKRIKNAYPDDMQTSALGENQITHADRFDILNKG